MRTSRTWARRLFWYHILLALHWQNTHNAAEYMASIELILQGVKKGVKTITDRHFEEKHFIEDISLFLEQMGLPQQNRLLKAVGIFLTVVAGLLFFWLFPLKLISRLAVRFGKSSPCPASLSWLVDNRIRRRYMLPILERVGLRPGEQVLELGPGPGTFTVKAAKRVGSEGRLVAIDIQPKMITQVENRIREAGLTNVELHVASAYDLPLDDASVDRAFLITVLPEIPDRRRALAELHRVLRNPDPAEGKPGGVLSITEEFSDPDYLFSCETIRLVEAAGFSLEQHLGNFWVYTANFRKTVA
jgi:arsenite methyltransferase